MPARYAAARGTTRKLTLYFTRSQKDSIQHTSKPIFPIARQVSRNIGKTNITNMPTVS